tara:strand:+ start:36 stop:962 length:927 start_codon:yes stop_codon:yes gene_type:complete
MAIQPNKARLAKLLSGLRREVSLTGTTFQDITIGDERSIQHYKASNAPGRYFLETYFPKRPGLNANLDQAMTVEVARALSDEFEVVGTNMTSALTTFSETYGGIKITTGGTDNDQTTVTPHLDDNDNSDDPTHAISAWRGVKWGSENQTEWSCCITTDTITTVSIHAGLKLTNDPTIATDANQAYFLFATDDDLGTLATNANLHFVYSIGGSDYLTDLGIAVAADTTYHLKIKFDDERKISAYVNGEQYSLNTTATVAEVTTPGKGTTTSAAMTNDIDFIPYIGLRVHAGSARSLRIHHQSISRVIFE